MTGTSRRAKPPAYDSQMQAVYARIHQEFFSLSTPALDVARSHISNTLGRFGIRRDQLAELVVLNVGSGREAVAFAELGAAHVYHFDVSAHPVDALNRYRAAHPEVADRITTTRADLCAAGSLAARRPVDFVYLHGVLHHLYDPGMALANIGQLLAPGARMFLRIYRSGSLRYLVVDVARRLVSFQHADALLAAAGEMSRVNARLALTSSFFPGWWDDFLVPVVNLFRPREIDAFFSHAGFAVGSAACPDYDHDDERLTTSVNLLYVRESVEQTISATGFPAHVDQLTGIAYRDPWIEETVAAMVDALPQLVALSEQRRAEVSLRLLDCADLLVDRRTAIPPLADIHRTLRAELRRALQSPRS